MKIFKCLLYLLPAIGLLFSSCKDDETYDGMNVIHFAKANSKVYVQAEGANTFNIEVGLLYPASSNLTIPVTITKNTNPDGDRIVVQGAVNNKVNVTISAGSYVGTIQMKGFFDGYTAEIDTIAFKIDDQYKAIGGSGTVYLATTSVFSQRKLTFVDFADGSFSSQFFEESWPQKIQKAIGADVYSLPDCYATGYPIEFTVNPDNTVSFDRQETGYKHPSYGMISFGPTPGVPVPSTKVGKVVTLKGLFYIPDGRYFTNSGSYFQEVLIFP